MGRHDDLLISKIVAWPGKQMQHLTTNEPDEGMIEVAIESLKLVLPNEEGKDKW